LPPAGETDGLQIIVGNVVGSLLCASHAFQAGFSDCHKKKPLHGFLRSTGHLTPVGDIETDACAVESFETVSDPPEYRGRVDWLSAVRFRNPAIASVAQCLKLLVNLNRHKKTRMQLGDG